MASPSSTPAFSPPAFLNISAISAKGGVSILECWQLLPGFATSSQTGTAGASILQLGNLANGSFSVIPPGFNAGFHNAPNKQYVPVPLAFSPLPPSHTTKNNRWVVFLSGLAHVSLANSTDEVFIHGGANGLVFAADTADVSVKGHSTNYPSGVETRVLQIPTGGSVPEHTVLYSGACKSPQLQGRSLDALD